MWLYYYSLRSVHLQNLKRRSLKRQFFRAIESGDLKKYKLPILRGLNRDGYMTLTSDDCKESGKWQSSKWN